MKMSKKIMMLGISLMLVTITLVGLTTSGDVEQNINSTSIPIFEVRFFNGIWDFHHPNVSNVNFHVYFENPNDVDINLQFLYFYVLDENGNLLYSYRPVQDPNCDCLQFHTEEFALEANENMSLTSVQSITRDSVTQYCWEYLSTALNNVRISGIFRLNGELQWFETSLCEINIPICK